MQGQRLKYFVDNREWYPLELKVEEKPQHGFSRLLFTVLGLMIFVVIQRQPSLYILGLILPSMALLVLDLLSHYVPKSYNEKVNFKITLLLGISVLMLILNDFLPASSDDPPIIVIVSAGTMILMAFGILETIVITYIEGKVQKPDITSAGTFPPYQGLNSCSKEVQLKEEEQETEDGAVSQLERICRDMHIVREQIRSLQSTENMEAEREKLQEKLEKFVFYSHLLLVTAFYITVFIKWKW